MSGHKGFTSATDNRALACPTPPPTTWGSRRVQFSLQVSSSLTLKSGGGAPAVERGSKPDPFLLLYCKQPPVRTYRTLLAVPEGESCPHKVGDKSPAPAIPAKDSNPITDPGSASRDAHTADRYRESKHTTLCSHFEFFCDLH